MHLVLHHFYLSMCNFYLGVISHMLHFTAMPLTKLIFMNIFFDFDACIQSHQLFLQPTFSFEHPAARRRPGLVNCCNNVAALSAMRSVTRHTHPD